MGEQPQEIDYKQSLGWVLIWTGAAFLVFMIWYFLLEAAKLGRI